jgi:hypothetical protein
MSFKLGRKRPPNGRAKLRFADYIQPSLPPPPPSCDYTGPATAVLGQMFLNDQLGDCVIAAGAHLVGLETSNAGDAFVYSDAQVLADYEAIGGYNPNDPSTDQGCDEQTAFQYWQRTGFADGTLLDKYLGLDATNPTQIQQAMYLFENLFFGVELPDAWVTPFPSSSGFVWDTGTPNPNNGHAFLGVGYNTQGVQIDSWGLKGTVTWAAITTLCGPSGGGQLYALLTPDQIPKATQRAPNGLDWATLQSDFDALDPRGGLTKK